MIPTTLFRLFRSGVYNGIACCLSALPLIAGCGRTAHDGTVTVQTESAGHKFTFVVPSAGVWVSNMSYYSSTVLGIRRAVGNGCV